MNAKNYVIVCFFCLASAFGQDSLTQRKHFVKFSSELMKPVEFDKKTNTLNDMVEITNGRSFGFNLGYQSFLYLNTFTRIGAGAELNVGIISTQINFQNPTDSANPNPQNYNLGKIRNFSLAVDIPFYYQSAIRFKNNQEFALSFGFKMRIIPYIHHEIDGQEKEVSVVVMNGSTNYSNTYTIDYGMELSRVIPFFTLGGNYSFPLQNKRAITFFTTMNIGGFNNEVNVFYENFDNSENGVYYNYEGDDRLYLRLKMAHLAFGLGYQF